MVEVNLRFPFVHRRKAMEVSHGHGYRREEEQGDVSPTRRWTDRLPHPTNMVHYDKWANDAEANIAFNVLTDIIAGVGYYTEMPEENQPKKPGDKPHSNKVEIDEYGEQVNLDEDLEEITMSMLQKGFCPVERLKDYDLKILPPETFYIYRDRKGKVLKYTQEYYQEQVENEWKGKEMDDIILFFHRRTTSWPYGKSLCESIGNLLDERDQMNTDMPKAIHRWAYPIPVMQTRRNRQTLQDAVEDRDLDEWIFIGNVEEGDVTWETIKIDPQARFIPYIELIYYQICEGLHAPLLLYLKNATEASANVMLESVDRLVNGIQRYIKRRVERFLFEPQVGKPVPRLIWGAPKTGLEEVALADIAQIFPHLAPNQQQDLLKQFGIQLPEPKWPKQPTQLPPQPFQKPTPQVPIEQMLEKLNDLDTSLNIIETNYKEKRINLIKAMKLGGNTIEVHLARVYRKNSEMYKRKRDEQFQQWSRRLIGVKEGKPTYHVTVDD